MTNEEIRELRASARLLGLSDEIDSEGLRKAFKNFARTWHPDKSMRDGLDAQNANKMMAEGNKAYRRLKTLVDENGGRYEIPEEATDADRTRNQTSRRDESDASHGYQGADPQSDQAAEPQGDYEDMREAFRRHRHKAEKTSVIGDMFESIRQPLSLTSFWEASFFGKVFRLLVHGFGLVATFLFLYAFADLTLPLDNMTADGMRVALFQDVLMSPMIVFILGLALFAVWAYRGIARFLFDFVDASGWIALAFDVLLLAGIAFASQPFAPMLRQAVSHVLGLMA